MTAWTIGAVLDAIADVIPDRLMTMCGTRRTTFAEARTRTRILANYLSDQGFGVVIGCLKARAVPVSVNHHYSPGEIRDLLEYLGPRGIIYHRLLGARFAEVLPESGTELMASIDDGSAVPELSGAVSLNDALAVGCADRDVEGSPDDLIMMCTGGTTGQPKRVLWRQSDMYVASMTGADHRSVEEIHRQVRAGGQPWFAVSPLMHAGGMWTAFAAFLNGLPVVLYEDRNKLDARSVWATAEREKVSMATMVGGAYAGTLVAELRAHPYDLSSLNAIGSGGATTSAKYKRALMECLPPITTIEGFGSFATGNMAFGYSSNGAASDTFAPGAGTAVVSADRSRLLRPGEPGIGWTARTGRIPLAYFNDAVATQRTFPEIDGRRVAIPGDRATVEKAGSIRLLGRDSLVVNTGGEKVFVEEVEEELRTHPDIDDALVIGRRSERWGQQVVALIARHPGSDVVADEALYNHCTSRLAHFKAPKAFIFVDQIPHLGNGKPNCRWARQAAVQRLPVKGSA
ncbi:AMP-binding protein [Mycobacterium decipiens]|uniref:Acyl-CoA synthetase n=1 Tax=Mycobacterium decipiens TaxID=1430326 RepID=A0A1X2LVS1_9MYCO|nr:AMP-binding protein [Mycobacterium decipiens]OSC41152.1 acyl-CoA synthetase [Mycobacterium decipiens]